MLEKQAGQPAVQGQGQGRGRTQTSTNEERWRYKKSGTWKYYREAEFQIESPFIHEVKEPHLAGIGKQRIKLWAQVGSTFSTG